MRIQLLSDLHFEFQRDGGAALVADCVAPDVDVLVLAGDIAVGQGIENALTMFSQRYPQVVYVHGNHEFYGSARQPVVELTHEVCARLGNVHWLDCNVLELGGRRFLGTPLWFAPTKDAWRYRTSLTDFAQIEDYQQWVYAENQRACAFLASELRAGDIVVTHHLPVRGSVLEQYRESPLNCYFLCDVEPLIRERSPALWMHGHTHGSVDITVGLTHIRCNPFGYARREENRGFEEKCVIEVPD